MALLSVDWPELFRFADETQLGNPRPESVDMKPILRTTIITLILAGAIFACSQMALNSSLREIRKLEAVNAELIRQIARREAMIKRLSRSRRIAHIQILQQPRDDSGKITETSLRLIELEEDGTEIARQSFTIPGDMLFVDTWTVKFDHEFVAEGHPLYGRTLLLLRRIYSEQMAPMDGYPIDTPGAIPPAYAASEVGLFEQRVWDHFWELAMDSELADSMKVRVAQGEVVYKPVREGQLYELVLDDSGGMNFSPLPVAETTLTQADD